ncbi:MAG: radical SAM protein [Deltaproteobacteria bacterium]|nr:radical SAM protein [Deltaproteobacteria bacterium]
MDDYSTKTAPPFLISWNLTKRCNLKCKHCYLDATELTGAEDTSTKEALLMIDKIADFAPSALLIITGGEPLLREDLTTITSYATEQGLVVVLGTNGTLLTLKLAKKLKASGVRGIGISLDSVEPNFHDDFRGLTGAWLDSITGIESTKKAGLDFQIQLTITSKNKGEVAGIIKLAAEKEATAVNIFFLVCTGRGQDVTDITPSEYEEVLKSIVEAEEKYGEQMMVRARCAPHFLRVAKESAPNSSLLKGETSGCIAARGYVRISSKGILTPCPYMPAPIESDLNLNKKSFSEIYLEDETFKKLRSPAYNGKCGDCEYSELCGGCRARSLATNGDLMGEDPWCDYRPKKNTKKITTNKTPISWTPEAVSRLKKTPFFLRAMIKKGLEGYARATGVETITPEIMAKLRKRTGR